MCLAIVCLKHAVPDCAVVDSTGLAKRRASAKLVGKAN
jgi:hypothetical protein